MEWQDRGVSDKGKGGATMKETSNPTTDETPSEGRMNEGRGVGRERRLRNYGRSRGGTTPW